MLIEYYANDYEDRKIDEALKDFDIKDFYNPEEGYYVISTEDSRIVTILSLLGIELYITETEKTWHEYAFDTNNIPDIDVSDK